MGCALVETQQHNVLLRKRCTGEPYTALLQSVVTGLFELGCTYCWHTFGFMQDRPGASDERRIASRVAARDVPILQL